MGKTKKTDLKEVVKKAEIESSKNRLSDFKEHTTKPIIKPKNKRKTSKEKINDGKRQQRKNIESKKTKVKPKSGTDDKGDKGQRSRRDKTKVPGAIVKGGERSGLDKILGKILPPWF